MLFTVIVAEPLLFPLFASGEVVLTVAVVVMTPAATARAVTVNVAHELVLSVPPEQITTGLPLHPAEAERNSRAGGR